MFPVFQNWSIIQGHDHVSLIVYFIYWVASDLNFQWNLGLPNKICKWRTGVPINAKEMKGMVTRIATRAFCYQALQLPSDLSMSAYEASNYSKNDIDFI
jgi:hypothetical protein